jgi:hypothetical protein
MLREMSIEYVDANINTIKYDRSEEENGSFEPDEKRI